MVNKLSNILENYVDKRGGLFSYFAEVSSSHGNPKFFRYLSVINNINDKSKVRKIRGSGFSLDRESSQWSAIGEAVERYCSRVIPSNEIIEGSFLNVSNSRNTLNPYNVTRYLDSQIDKYPRFRTYSHDLELRWSPCWDILNERVIFVPYELIYLDYINDYKPIREIISTGLACAQNIKKAVVSGLNECIERDAFVLFWLFNKVNFKLNNFSVRLKQLDELLLLGKNRDLSIEIFDITQEDIKVPTILTLVKNKNRKGFYFGCASNFKYETALLKSVEEGLGGYSAYVESIDNYNVSVPKDKNKIMTLDDHCLYYIYGNNDEILERFHNTSIVKDYEQVKYDVCFEEVKDRFKKMNYSIIIKDLTTVDVSSLGLFVARVITPELAFLSVGDPMLNSKRINDKKIAFNINKLNLEPHPFP